MRRVWVLVLAIAALGAGASSALAHPERATQYPDASKGAVKPGQDLPLTLSWRLVSSTAQPLEVRFGGGSLALPR